MAISNFGRQYADSLTRQRPRTGDKGIWTEFGCDNINTLVQVNSYAVQRLRVCAMDSIRFGGHRHHVRGTGSVFVSGYFFSTRFRAPGSLPIQHARSSQATSLSKRPNLDSCSTCSQLVPCIRVTIEPTGLGSPSTIDDQITFTFSPSRGATTTIFFYFADLAIMTPGIHESINTENEGQLIIRVVPEPSTSVLCGIALLLSLLLRPQALLERALLKTSRARERQTV